MNVLFWQRMHGGSTHFPIVLLMVSVVFDVVAWWHEDGARRGLRLAGFICALVGVVGGGGAIISGLAMSHGRILGSGYERFHHLFVWPAFGLAIVLVAWRSLRRGWIAQPVPRGYLAGMTLASGLMLGAGYWGGEMLLGTATTSIADPKMVATGRQLFLMNCAHCHGTDARGDEGPDLHGVVKSDEHIAALIMDGKKGEMPKFSAKLSTNDVAALVAYIRSLD